MTWGEAVSVMVAGGKVRRPNWAEDDHVMTVAGYFMLIYSDGGVPNAEPYLPSQEAIASHDWVQLAP